MKPTRRTSTRLLIALCLLGGIAAATLMGRFLSGRKGAVGVIAGSLSLRDHAERQFGFHQILSSEHPDLTALPALEGRDDSERTCCRSSEFSFSSLSSRRITSSSVAAEAPCENRPRLKAAIAVPASSVDFMAVPPCSAMTPVRPQPGNHP